MLVTCLCQLKGARHIAIDEPALWLTAVVLGLCTIPQSEYGVYGVQSSDCQEASLTKQSQKWPVTLIRSMLTAKIVLQS